MKLFVNGKEYSVDGKTVKDVLGHFDLQVEGVVVEHNKQLVRREAYGSVELSEHDQLEIVTLVGGG